MVFFYTAVEYWIKKLQNDFPLLLRFNKQFILEGLSIILEVNYFYINGICIHQIKGTAMETKLAVVGSNLVVAYKEVNMFALLPQFYPQDFVDFFIRNDFRFLDDVFHKWFDNFDIEPFYSMINNLDPNLKLIFENPSTSLNFLDINIQIVENSLVFNIHYKPTNSFNYLTYINCHPPHTKNNISLSLAKHIVSIVTNNRENRLKKLKEHLLDRKHPQHIIDYSFTKIFQRKFQTENNDSITFIRTYNPKHNITFKKFHICLNKIKNKELKTCFQRKKILLSTRQRPNLRKRLTTAIFERLPIPKQIKHVGFYPCTNCIYHKNAYFKECLSFSFKSKNKLLTWHNRRSFSCDSIDVLYVPICKCWTN